MTAPYFEKNGFYVKAVNFLDMAHSDGWNCLAGLDTNPDLVTTVANTIIQNTSGPKEADDFWSRAELNLLMALIHYVCNKKDDRSNLLPLEQRSLGDVYKILAYKSVNEINRTLAELPPEHPAKGPHGLFLKARENLWGNIIIGLGNRLAVFQNPLVDKITRNHDVDLLLPGQRPCAYFVIISAQDSAYRFLSSLFFSLTFPQLSNYARLHGGRLPVLTNFCLEEYLNIGYMEGISDVFNSIRGFNMSVQVAVQSLSQWKEKYPGMEWENQLGSFDMTLYMGCNDMTSAEYFAKKCGKVTISVTNNQFPLAPLFSPVYSTTRPYSQTRSNTQRDLLQPDEFLRLDKFKCIVMFNHYKPAELYKIMLEELPAYKELVKCSVFDYVPEWKRREDENKKRTPQKTASVPHETSVGHSPQAAVHFVPQENTSEKKQVPDREKNCTRKPHAVALPRQKSGEQCIYDFSDMKEGTSPEDIGLVEMTRSAVIGEDDSDLEELDDPSRIPPGRGI
jgi:type IV secretion system protein VirD4